MTKTEFLKKLQEELEQGMAPAEVRENVEYYRNYIEDEKAKGESEDAVVNSLGDPWAIAKNILESPEDREPVAVDIMKILTGSLLIIRKAVTVIRKDRRFMCIILMLRGNAFCW